MTFENRRCANVTRASRPWPHLFKVDRVWVPDETFIKITVIKKKNSRHFVHFSSWKWNLSQSFRCSFFVVICIQCPNSQNYHPLEDVAGLTRHQQKGIRHLKNVVIQNQSQDLFAWNWIEGDTLSLSRGSIQMPWYHKRSFHQYDKNY